MPVLYKSAICSPLVLPTPGCPPMQLLLWLPSALRGAHQGLSSNLHMTCKVPKSTHNIYWHLPSSWLHLWTWPATDISIYWLANWRQPWWWWTYWWQWYRQQSSEGHDRFECPWCWWQIGISRCCIARGYGSVLSPSQDLDFTSSDVSS